MPDSLDAEHQDLLQFLYQFPIGVIDVDEDGTVHMINPAASRMLSPEAGPGETVAEPLTILRRLAVELFDRVAERPDQLGMLTSGRGYDIDSSVGDRRFAVTVHRLRPGRLTVSLTDVTEERRLLVEQRLRASRLQRALLGRIDVTDLDVSVAYLPAHEQDLSGGDWYDVVDLGDGRYAFVVGDVVGHDIEASATMGQLRAIVRGFALVDPDPVSVLGRTEHLAKSIDGALAATVHYALLDQDRRTVSYASAGHPPPLLVRNGGEPELLTEGRRPLLAVADDVSAASAVTQVGAGDVLVMYTDGLIERRGESLDAGFERLLAAARRCRPDEDTVEEIIDVLTSAMLADTDHDDDVCALAVRCRPTVGGEGR